MGYKCTKIESGTYSYRGFTIYNRGYHSGDKSVCWEGVNDKQDSWVIPAFSKSDVKSSIDYELDVLCGKSEGVCL